MDRWPHLARRTTDRVSRESDRRPLPERQAIKEPNTASPPPY